MRFRHPGEHADTRQRRGWGGMTEDESERAGTSSRMMSATRSSFISLGSAIGSCRNALVVMDSRTCKQRSLPQIGWQAARWRRGFNGNSIKGWAGICVCVCVTSDKTYLAGLAATFQQVHAPPRNYCRAPSSIARHRLSAGIQRPTESATHRGAFQQHIPLHYVAGEPLVVRHVPGAPIEQDFSLQLPRVRQVTRQDVQLRAEAKASQRISCPPAYKHAVFLIQSWWDGLQRYQVSALAKWRILARILGQAKTPPKRTPLRLRVVPKVLERNN
jgi:hypothetical protein